MTAATEDPLVLAVPSKGRLQENAAAFFARAGLDIVKGRGSRDYRGELSGLKGVEVAFLSAADIVAQLASGAAHMGVTGEDLVRETIPGADARVALLTPLGFGGANVVVAVPRAWIDVKTMADLEDVAAAFRARRGERMRVTTKYVNLTRRFFAERHVGDYRIVESSGATEGAPAAGQAELIVDITTTGATLDANALKILDDGVILRSQANLVASLGAKWGPAARENARIILSRIAAEETARTTREVTTVLPGWNGALLDEARALFAVQPRSGAGEARITFNCPAGKVAALADWLTVRGADFVAVAALDYVFTAANPLYRKLIERLPKNRA
ncbi:ATP phosphoribosyltransferase [Methylocapsa palsarum]|uniref:ATP phosphoribosyltransferase n=1 Tax=Methylocapsa palsarum TaxID=1612308 RepID=A0A1I3WU37_9HYPH|nr:ATP phosphoribosyltransferase [Methylocapsa palsarum]SFK11002.1 ATP phosphoribosyltransferase [Methylocapsa palsarum]